MALTPTIRETIRRALSEDTGREADWVLGDPTSHATIPAETPLEGTFLVKAEGVIAGLEVVSEVFRLVDPTIRYEPLVAEGSHVRPGDTAARVWGNGPGILTAERVALNFLQRMSGIATMAQQYTQEVSGTNCRILDTRKTVPGLRELDKLAVALGGGTNHRIGLYDMVLIKDNHIEAAGGIQPAVERVRAQRPDLAIEVEVESLEQLDEVLPLNVDRIMLDNMSPEIMREAVRRTNGRSELEASGGITIETVRAAAESGVDYVSVGALTHSVVALDVSLEIVMAPTKETAATDDLDAMSDAQVAQAIWDAKAALGSRLAILGHHYQRDEVIQFADYRGDSLGLSKRAASLPEADYIVFCGVYFMAETAAILAQTNQIVCQPVPEALCPMARLANAEEIGVAWEALDALWNGDLIPLTYQNSIAEAKDFVGRHGGAVCTSSNAADLFSWAFLQKKHILFLPDEHLGTNTALAMGVPPEQIGIWDPIHPPDPDTLADCRVVVWKGFCYVHTGFTVDDVQQARDRHSNARIIVHPECPHEVVAQADASGSTTGIISDIEAAAPGSTIYVGTEGHLVERLGSQYTDRTVLPLATRYCRTMGMTRMRHLLAVLQSLLDGDPINVVNVPGDIAEGARLALERMLEASN